MCHKGYPNLCDEMPGEATFPRVPGSGRRMRKLLGLGTFSTSTVVPHDVVIPIDKSVPLAQAALNARASAVVTVFVGHRRTARASSSMPAC